MVNGLPVDLAFGDAGFGDFLYVTERNTQTIYRVAPDGSVAPFATGFNFSFFAFDGDITFSPDGNTMYVASTSDLVIISAIPEPTALTLTLLGGVSAIARFRRRWRNI
jgi:sugar lactone lactonase YvrE